MITEKICLLWGEFHILRFLSLPSDICVIVFLANTDPSANRNQIQRLPLFTWATLTTSYTFVLAFSWTEVKISLLIRSSQTTAFARHLGLVPASATVDGAIARDQKEPKSSELSAWGSSACLWMLYATDEAQKKNSVSGFGQELQSDGLGSNSLILTCFLCDDREVVTVWVPVSSV